MPNTNFDSSSPAHKNKPDPQKTVPCSNRVSAFFGLLQFVFPCWQSLNTDMGSDKLPVLTFLSLMPWPC